MKTLLSLALATGCLSGCALFYDAPRTDADFGRAQTACWSRQIANPTPAARERTPEGIGGLPAEEVMRVYNQSFGAPPSKENVFSLELAEDGGQGGN